MSGTLDVISTGAVTVALSLFALTIVAFAAEWSFAAKIPVAAVAEQSAVPVAVAARSAGGTTLLERPAPAGPLDAAPRRARQAGAIGLNLTGLATVVLGLGVLARGLSAHRVPWGDLYEFSITGTFVVLATWLVASRRYPLRFLAIWLVGFATTCLGVARLFFYRTVGPLTPALSSHWLLIHVSCAILATGAFTVAGVITVLYLLKAHAERSGQVTGYLARLPPSETLDRLAYRLIAFGFPIWTAAVIFGAIWAQYAYGQFWQWDPKETWALITWICYAAYLHARATAGWRGRIAATIAVVAFSTVIFNLLIVNFVITGQHSYAG